MCIDSHTWTWHPFSPSQLWYGTSDSKELHEKKSGVWFDFLFWPPIHLKLQFVSTILGENSLFGAGVEPCFLTPQPRRIASSLATSDMVGGLAVQAAEQAGWHTWVTCYDCSVWTKSCSSSDQSSCLCTCAGFFKHRKKGLKNPAGIYMVITFHA